MQFPGEFLSAYPLAISAFLCFHRYRRMHLHFCATGQGTGVRGQEVDLCARAPRPDMESSVEFFRSFVFIDIAGCTFIFVEQESGLRTQELAVWTLAVGLPEGTHFHA